MGAVERFPIPGASTEFWRFATKGEATPIGQFTYASNLIVHLGLDGKPLSFTDGVGAFTGASGNSIFFTLTGLFQPAAAATPNVFPFDAVYIVTGGTGKFAGAIGSGRIRGEANLDKAQFVGAWSGLTRTLGG